MSIRARQKLTRPDSKMLIDSLRVTPISSNSFTVPTVLPIRIMGNRKNYQEFKSVYESNIKETMSAQRPSTELSESYCTIDPISCTFKRIQKPPTKYSSTEFCPSPPIKSQIQVKTVRAPVPRSGNKTAIVQMQSTIPPRKVYRPVVKRTADKNTGSAHAFIEQLRSIEKEHQLETNDLIAQANKEIHIASTQIQQIQGLLSGKLSQLDHLGVSKNLKTKADPRWNTDRTRSMQNVKQKKVEQKMSNEKNKLLDALNTLNSKLQKMQDKYFRHPRIRYRSIRNSPNRSVEFIFKNRKFEGLGPLEMKKESKTSEPKSSAPVLQPKPNTTDLRSLVLSELEKDSTTKTKIFKDPIFKDPITDVKHQISKTYESLLSDICTRTNTRRTYTNYPVMDVIDESPRSETHKQHGDGSESVRTENNQCEGDKSSLHNIEEIIVKSNYLSKEFKIDPRNGITKNSMKNAIPNNDIRLPIRPRNINERMECNRYMPDRRTREANIQENINTALRNSLFTALENK